MQTRQLIAAAAFAAILIGCKPESYSTAYNLDFEYRLDEDTPTIWGISDESYHGYATSLDFVQRQHGKASLRMEQTDPEKSGWAIFAKVLPGMLVAGHEVALSGWIKTEDVTDGFADLLLIECEQIDYNEYPLDTPGRDVRHTSEWTRITLRKRIAEHTAGVQIGGILKGPGKAWFDNLELAIDGKPFRDTLVPAPKTRLTCADKRELRKYLYPLRTFEPYESNYDDLRVLDTLIGKSSVVALGENTHGSSEIFKMKERMIHYLAANRGFDLFSIEANLPESYRLNTYLRDGQGSPEQPIYGMGMWIWKTQEMLSLVKWMRFFNLGGGKMTFTGFDMQEYDESLNILETAFEEDRQATLLLGQIETALKKAVSISSVLNYVIDSDIAQKIKSDLAQIESKIERLPLGEGEKEWLRRNSRLIRQFLGLGPRLWRDWCMAENLLWIKRQNPSSRIIIWAHNGHIQRGTAQMGDVLQDSLGADYVNFGFTFYDGKYTGVHRDNDDLVQQAQRAYPGTLEYLLDKLDEPIFLLDLKRMREEESPALAWIDDLKFRHVGAIKINDEFPDRNVTESFDYLIFIRESTPSHVLFLDK